MSWTRRPRGGSRNWRTTAQTRLNVIFHPRWGDEGGEPSRVTRTGGGSSWCPAGAPQLVVSPTMSCTKPTSASARFRWRSARGSWACPPPRRCPSLKQFFRLCHTCRTAEDKQSWDGSYWLRHPNICTACKRVKAAEFQSAVMMLLFLLLRSRPRRGTGCARGMCVLVQLRKAGLYRVQ